MIHVPISWPVLCRDHGVLLIWKSSAPWIIRKQLLHAGSTIRTLLHGKINPKDWQVASPLVDVGFLLFFRVVSGDYGKPWKMSCHFIVGVPPPWKLTWCWKITIFKWEILRYIFKWLEFSIVMLVCSAFFFHKFPEWEDSFFLLLGDAQCKYDRTLDLTIFSRQMTRWWFSNIFFHQDCIGNDPIWLVFFRGLKYIISIYVYE